MLTVDSRDRATLEEVIFSTWVSGKVNGDNAQTGCYYDYYRTGINQNAEMPCWESGFTEFGYKDQQLQQQLQQANVGRQSQPPSFCCNDNNSNSNGSGNGNNSNKNAFEYPTIHNRNNYRNSTNSNNSSLSSFACEEEERANSQVYDQTSETEENTPKKKKLFTSAFSSATAGEVRPDTPESPSPLSSRKRAPPASPKSPKVMLRKLVRTIKKRLGDTHPNGNNS